MVLLSGSELELELRRMSNPTPLLWGKAISGQSRTRQLHTFRTSPHRSSLPSSQLTSLSSRTQLPPPDLLVQDPPRMPMKCYAAVFANSSSSNAHDSRSCARFAQGRSRPLMNRFMESSQRVTGLPGDRKPRVGSEESIHRVQRPSSRLATCPAQRHFLRLCS